MDFCEEIISYFLQAAISAKLFLFKIFFIFEGSPFHSYFGMIVDVNVPYVP